MALQETTKNKILKRNQFLRIKYLLFISFASGREFHFVEKNLNKIEKEDCCLFENSYCS